MTMGSERDVPADVERYLAGPTFAGALPEDDVKYRLRVLADGETLQDAAKRVSVGGEALRTWARDHCSWYEELIQERSEHGSLLSDDEQQRRVAALRTHDSVPQAAHSIGMSTGVLRRWARQHWDGYEQTFAIGDRLSPADVRHLENSTAAALSALDDERWRDAKDELAWMRDILNGETDEP
jgi:transposase-like protein